tara:strand:+ start:895 stop:1086 length:192 start_codon:yes stop_codon:yes gene_type:complete
MSDNPPPSSHPACEDAPTTKEAESGLTWKAMCEACYVNEPNPDAIQLCMDNVMEKYANQTDNN